MSDKTKLFLLVNSSFNDFVDHWCSDNMSSGVREKIIADLQTKIDQLYSTAPAVSNPERAELLAELREKFAKEIGQHAENCEWDICEEKDSHYRSADFLITLSTAYCNTQHSLDQKRIQELEKQLSEAHEANAATLKWANQKIADSLTSHAKEMYDWWTKRRNDA